MLAADTLAWPSWDLLGQHSHTLYAPTLCGCVAMVWRCFVWDLCGFVCCDLPGCDARACLPAAVAFCLECWQVELSHASVAQLHQPAFTKPEFHVQRKGLEGHQALQRIARLRRAGVTAQAADIGSDHLERLAFAPLPSHDSGEDAAGGQPDGASRQHQRHCMPP